MKIETLGSGVYRMTLAGTSYTLATFSECLRVGWLIKAGKL